jgi:putative membrane-bound dehydrogenase-like protein
MKPSLAFRATARALLLLATPAFLAAQSAKPVAESPLVTADPKARLAEISADLRGARELHLVAHDGGNQSCDWANWIEPVLVMADGSTRPLASLAWKSAGSAYGKVNLGRNMEGGPLAVAGKTYADGIGTHAESLISYDLPAGVVGFRSKVAIDDGGAVRNGQPSEAGVRFRVYTQRPRRPGEIVDTGDTLVPPGIFAVPEGLEVTVWATTPMLNNPTNIDFDERGRLFVAEGVNYRSKGNRRPEGDRVLVLEDTDGDGRADKSSVFVQEPFLASPLGVAAIDGKVVVAQPPDLLVYHDANRDGRFDPATERREVLLTGFSGRQHDHSLHSVTVGPDGRWIFNFGNCGAEFKDRDGKVFRVGSPYMTQKMAGLRSDDGNVWIGGATVGMNPDGTGARILGHNYRNSYEQAVTSLGDLFQSDNDDPPACRVSHILEGGNAGFASADGKRTWEADRRPGQDVPTAEWRQEDPGTMPAGDVYGGGSPTGVAFYENGALGDKWSGLLLACEAGKNVIFGYFPKPDGAGFKLERFDFITSNREREWAGSDFLGGRPTGELKTLFRPADVAVGPDGAIYFADWFDPGVGGHGTRDNRLAGTIYRLAPKGFKPVVPKLDLATPEGQVLALRSPAPNVRGAAFHRLKARGEAAVPAVAALLPDDNPYVAARAVFLLAQLGDKGADLVRRELASADDTRRLVAFRALRAAGVDVLATAARLAKDPSPAVRREVALALRAFPATDALPLLAEVARRHDGKDRAYLEAVGLGATGREAELWSLLAKEAPANPSAWSPAFVDLTWRLHPPASVPGVLARIRSGQLDAAAVRRALTGLAFTRSASAAHAMVELASDPAFAQRDLAKWWLMNRKGNDWKEFKVDELLRQRGLFDPAKATFAAAELPPVAPGAPRLGAVESIARLAGDPARGKVRAGVCLACHKLGDQGIEYGPDLTAYGRNQSRENVILGISQPDAEISHGYEGSRLVTTEGVVINGIVLSSADPVIIKSMGGLVQTVPRSRIRELAPLRRSLMFHPSQMGLDDQAVADLAAYLKTL